MYITQDKEWNPTSLTLHQKSGLLPFLRRDNPIPNIFFQMFEYLHFHSTNNLGHLFMSVNIL